MRPLKKQFRPLCAATLVEVMIGAAIGVMVLGGIVLGGVALQRTYYATDQYSRAMEDQMLVTDYIARDLRRALTVTVTNLPGGTQKLTLTMPDYIDSSTGQPRLPTVTRGLPVFGSSTGTVDYSATPVTVSYYVLGQSLIREVGGVSSVVSNSMQNFQLTDIDAGTYVSDNVTFVPQFSRTASASSRTATSIPSTIYLRNKRRN